MQCTEKHKIIIVIVAFITNRVKLILIAFPFRMSLFFQHFSFSFILRFSFACSLSLSLVFLTHARVHVKEEKRRVVGPG